MGMDILSTFQLVKGHVNFLLVVINYFTKWIKFKPLAIITPQQIPSRYT